MTKINPTTVTERSSVARNNTAKTASTTKKINKNESLQLELSRALMKSPSLPNKSMHASVLSMINSVELERTAYMVQVSATENKRMGNREIRKKTNEAVPKPDITYFLKELKAMSN